jgi:hypothetical protein
MPAHQCAIFLPIVLVTENYFGSIIIMVDRHRPHSCGPFLWGGSEILCQSATHAIEELAALFNPAIRRTQL